MIGFPLPAIGPSSTPMTLAARDVTKATRLEHMRRSFIANV